ncbi:hypothetical protein AN964_14160 [Heyndrickxia shackletonii]|uniref:RNA dependent RNA polymerase n=1 Tax=Heyndrickxia shackletonii TaxID=157838 RepID=A0A0Q3WTE1_9BACI|nr:hypothetical protein [Heyndrickxia shackletonii]KQL54524.1 hypothetical protein AN964_14160 [Heyndrickxia shackletonii]NEZ02055.1 hypothetical protein [Heyndrickxia shackletonii]
MANQNDITKGCYIPSIEACDLWEHMNRDKKLFTDYIGFLPYSLELIKLNEQEEFSTFTSNRNPNKLLSRDVINVKFDNIVKDSEALRKLYQKQLDDADEQLKEIRKEYEENKCNWSNKQRLHRINTYLYKRSRRKLLNSIPDNWAKVSKEDLRHELYKNGFKITRIDKKTGKEEVDVYKMYKRSSSKSRKGQCLFIKVDLYKKMIKYSRMYLSFEEGESIDLASLSAYQSLVTSSIEAVKVIDPNSILVVDEVISRWIETETVNVIKTVDGKVDSVPDDKYEVKNSIFDGEALLDSEFFEEGQSMLLLRSHWTKAAAFSTNLQTFFKDYAEEHGEDYDTWKVPSMFGEEVPVKSIKMILNPTCIKFLKMSHLFKKEGENEKDHGHLWQKRIWEHWKTVVESEGNVWGVCKHDKTNRRDTIDGMPLQRMSYQMVNSLLASAPEIEELSQFEINYIMDLKNKPEKFIKHVQLNLNKNDDIEEDDEDERNKIDYFSSDKMFIDLYSMNKEIIHNSAFKKFRADTIADYVKDVKRGRLKIVGDYATLFSCPLEYLYKAVGAIGNEINVPIGLKENEVYTTLFGKEGFGEEFTICRNPHTSVSNIWIGKCTYNEDIKEYFNLSPNVIVINTIRENVMNRLSGCDMDSDTAVVFRDEHLLNLAKKVYGKYNVCVNELDADKTPYTLTTKSMAELDHTLAKSTTEIGSIINLSQLCSSLYFHYLNNGKNKNDELVKEIYKQTDILTILSMCSIDSAKRQYKIKIGSELRKIQKYVSDIVNKDFEGNKPNFFQYIDKKESVTFTHYDTPMDYLYDILSNLDDADSVDTWKFRKFLDKVSIDNANRKQRKKVEELVTELTNELKSIHSKKLKKKEKNKKISDTLHFYLKKIGKLKIKPDTMYSILKDIDDKKYSSIKLHLMNCLYQAHTETFLNCFKKSHG